MFVRWTKKSEKHIRGRSERYSGATEIEPAWTVEAAEDKHAIVRDPDPNSNSGALRIIGFSPSAGFLITVIAFRIDDELWGATAWKTTGGDRRGYEEGAQNG